MIWKFTSSNTHLFGSIHVLKDANHPYTKIIDDIYSQSTQIVFEADISKVDLSLTKYNNGQKLSDEIPTNLFNETRTKWLEYGLPIEDLENTKPCYVAINIIFALLDKLGYSFEAGVDNQLLERAKNDNKKIIYLEPANRGLQPFNNATLNEQTQYLSRVVTNINTNIVEFETLMTSWLNNDIEEIENILNMNIKNFPFIINDLILERNKEWLQELSNIIKKGTATLISVGTLHCVGKSYCIQNMLRDNHGHDSSNII